MNVLIWVGVEYLDQFYKITNCQIPDEKVFDNAVEYTERPVMEGQLQVSIEYNKYINLTDRGLLLPWAGA